MGSCSTKKGDFHLNIGENSNKDSNSVNNVSKGKDDAMNINRVFEEIADIQDLKIKGAMLLSESIGKPKENYDTLENICAVPYGLIKKVRHKLSNKIRAVRIIKKELIEVQEEETLLFKELAILRTLDHPNIIKLFEFYRDDKFYYLINEYCSKGDLFKIIKQNPRGFNEFTVCHMMKQLLSVILYCNQKNIVNRDLRPENIFVERIEERKIVGEILPLFHIRVVDFKSARSFSKSKKLNKKVGNPFYIAPEVLRRKYNEKCDIWSCGIIMYILLTGKPPFSGTTDKEILDKVERGQVFEYFDNDFKDMSPECKHLIKEMLKFDPVKRISVEDALKHRWIKNFTLPVNVDPNFILTSYSNLMKFSVSQDKKFAQASLAYMVHHLTDIDSLTDIRNLFVKFDMNCDGKISYNEFLEGYKRTVGGIIQNDKEFIKVMKKIDQSKSGDIEYEEFVRAMIDKTQLVTEDNLRITFQMFDRDGSGSIEPGEIKQILGLSAKYSDKVWNEIINQIEHENENEITYEEFKAMMIKLIE